MAINAECAKNSLKSEYVMIIECVLPFSLVLRQLLVYGLPRFHVVSEVVVCVKDTFSSSVINIPCKAVVNILFDHIKSFLDYREYHTSNDDVMLH